MLDEIESKTGITTKKVIDRIKRSMTLSQGKTMHMSNIIFLD